eukprot:TRINITY_DN72697_c0_g1_i1.p1 TRINITY_DN72697_c0_g1~~TRINITY_DN72697_c0_g1_i1.p1  ORF type:complete len:258 (+),score=18.16 TRINITY_DN72697_c0_g1_i1:130-903(+)
MSSQLWIVVGGADKGGILVRTGQELASPQVHGRLATGALVEQLELNGERLRYRMINGAGPATGWVSLRLPKGKDLVVRQDSISGGDSWPTHPLDDDEWQEKLEPARYAILRDKETEPMGSGEYNTFFPNVGYFECAGCGTPLYSAGAKMKGGCGWPAFSRCYAGADGRPQVVCQVDWDAGGREILCRCCGGHLGHVFMDGSPHRHCVNSLSLVYVEGSVLLPEGSSTRPPLEVLCDMSDFARQLQEHVETGSYQIVS